MKKGLVLFFLCLFLGSISRAACFDHGMWNKILAENVDSYGVIDLDGIRVNKGGGNLIEYLTFLEIADLSTCGEADKKAFWLNAFNANVVRQILDRSGIKNLTDDSSVFIKRAYVAGKEISLNEIYHRILRLDPSKKGPIPGLSVSKLDPRIHFALSFSTIGSARLKNISYTGDNLEEELNWAAIEFVNDPRHIRIENDQLIMSSIFNWYKADFVGVGGVPAFITKYLDSEKRSDVAELKDKIKKDFPDGAVFEYDWTVNKKY